MSAMPTGAMDPHVGHRTVPGCNSSPQVEQRMPARWNNGRLRLRGGNTDPYVENGGKIHGPPELPHLLSFTLFSVDRSMIGVPVTADAPVRTRPVTTMRSRGTSPCTATVMSGGTAT